MLHTFLRRLAPLALPLSSLFAVAQTSPQIAEIRTPPAPETPRINGTNVFGVRPGSDFLFTIPASGRRPMTFAVEGLPVGLTLNATTGRISGKLAKAGEFKIVLKAKNALGSAEKPFKIICGDTIALTPAMGWSSWNCWGAAVDQEKVLKSAKALVSSGLANHGWLNINIDDGWQGKRDPKTLALQPNERFPDMKKLCDEIHAMGFRIGIYSGPWITTYAGYPGSSSDDPKGSWERLQDYEPNKRFGKYSFAKQDAKQWAEWGFDYLKYDWHPNDVPHTKVIFDALRATGRDIVLSVSCGMPFEEVGKFTNMANSWRTTGDIWDTWETPGSHQWSISQIGFSQDPWTQHSGPGHFNDPDMLVVGWVGWGPDLHNTRLTPAEQYTHITMWCMLNAPLLIGCDLERLDPFTLNLLTNDEVIAVDQDTLAKQGSRIATIGAIDVYKKELEDGSFAFAFFNRGDVPHTVAAKMDRMGCSGPQQVRDLWRQKDLPEINGDFNITVGVHDAELFKFKSKR